MHSYPRVFSITQDSTWQEKLDEYFEETACHHDSFQTPEQYQTQKGESYQLGLIEPKLVSGEADFGNCLLVKLGSGESEGLRFGGQLDPSHSVSELTAHLLEVLPRKTEALSILLVDDDPDLCLLLKDEWENKAKTKTHVNVQPNGLEALKVLEHFTPDVIVVDLKMPVLSGADFYKKYRRQNRETPVLLLTAITESGEIAQLREWGNPPIIEKASSESLPDDLWWRLIKLELLGSRDLR